MAKKQPTKSSSAGKKQTKTKTASATSPAEGTAKWFRTGDEAVAEKTRLDNYAKMRKEKSIPRFRLAAGEKAKVVFVDDIIFAIREHNLQVGGRWGNYVTCTKPFVGSCPICDDPHIEFSRKSAPLTAYFTIIDTREFTNKNTGTKSKNKKILYPAKGSAITILKKLKEKNGSLVGVAFEIERFSAEDPNCGIGFDKLGKVSLAQKFGREATVPIDYEKVLAPATKDELLTLGVGGIPVIGSSEDVAPDEDVSKLF